MKIYPSTEELEPLVDQLTALYNKMHKFSNAYPGNEDEFIGVAVRTTQVIWQLNAMIERAEHVERTEQRKQDRK